MGLCYIHDETREFIIDLDKVCYVRRINTERSPGMDIFFFDGISIHISSPEEVTRVWQLFRSLWGGEFPKRGEGK